MAIACEHTLCVGLLNLMHHEGHEDHEGLADEPFDTVFECYGGQTPQAFHGPDLSVGAVGKRHAVQEHRDHFTGRGTAVFCKIKRPVQQFSVPLTPPQTPPHATPHTGICPRHPWGSHPQNSPPRSPHRPCVS
jgi:hypothetical protein